MGSSLLLKLARDSMLEVYQAKRLIDKEHLLKEYPILATPMACKVSIYLEKELFSFFETDASKPLLENVILAAKKAAFESDKQHTLSSINYLHAEVELTLFTPDGTISERDEPLVSGSDTFVDIDSNTFEQ